MSRVRPAHIPVLLHEVLAAIDPKPGQTVVDCTLGLAGHSAALLERLSPKKDSGLPPGRLIAFDLDPANLERARERLTNVARGGATFDLINANFASLERALAEREIPGVHAVLADVGVASTQIDDPARGFSYRRDGPLDMRMDPTRGTPASTLLARITEADLATALLELGDETDAPAIARLIVQRRAVESITTTFQLSAIVCEARDFTLKRAAGAKLHPAARTFQALRILVNRELANLENLLRVLPSTLLPGGVAAIITFHSGEDRLVKDAFRQGLRTGVYAHADPEPIIADASEVQRNPRSRSAKLRIARRA